MKSNVQKIHEATMRIMERTGVKFHHPDAVKILKEHNIRMDGDVAYFTEDEIMYWMHKAPQSLTFSLLMKNTMSCWADATAKPPLPQEVPRSAMKTAKSAMRQWKIM